MFNRFWLLPHIDSHVFRGVPNFYTWITLWNCHQIETLDFSNYWAGNAMYPYPFAFALSENMMGITPFAIPIWFASKNPVLTANLVSILLLWLTAIMTFLMVRRMVGGTAPAVVAALIFSLYPWTLKAFSLGRFHMLGLMWLPVIVFANWRFWESGRKRYLWVMGIFWLWTFLISLYLGIFLGILLGIWNVVWFFYQKKSFSLRKIVGWVLCVVVVWAAMVPIFLTYQQVGRDTGMVRTLENQTQYTGPVWSWLKVSDENWLWGKTLKFLPTGSRDGIVEDFMFPGFIVLGFFIFSFFVGNLPRWLKSLRLTGLILFVCSMGPFTLGIPWKIPLPFTLLWYLYPPLQATRNPHRFSLFVVLIVAILAAHLIRRIKFGKSLKMVSVVLLGLGISLESLTLVTPRRALRPEARSFYENLKTDKPKHTLIELPVSIQTDIRAMVSSGYHWNRLINGVSGVWPPLQSQLEGEMRRFPNGHAIRLLQSLGVDRIVIHEARYGKRRKQLIRHLRRCPETVFLFRKGMLSSWSLKPGEIRKEFNGKDHLSLSGPSKGIAGEVNFGLTAQSADRHFLFNLKAPSRFSFTPSRLWSVRAWAQESGQLLVQDSWRPPALFHPHNRWKKLRLGLKPGHNGLVIGVDMMGEEVRFPHEIEVVSLRDPGFELPGALKLPQGHSGIALEKLRVDLKILTDETDPARDTGFVSLRVRVTNPGPYYWRCGAEEAVVLKMGIEKSGRITSLYGFDLPHDLFPGDDVVVPVRQYLGPGPDRAGVFLNCFLKSSTDPGTWFPSGNRIRIGGIQEP